IAVTRRPSRSSSTGGPGTLETTALNDAARAAVRATSRRALPGSSSATSDTISSGAAAQRAADRDRGGSEQDVVDRCPMTVADLPGALQRGHPEADDAPVRRRAV